MFDLDLITTTTGNGYGLNADLTYLNKKTKDVVAGYYKPKSPFSKAEVHISPKVTMASEVLFRATAGHELIHAYHFYRFGARVEKKFTERVAYEYTYNVLMNGGYQSRALGKWGLSYDRGFWGAYPSSYKVPQIFNW